MKRIPLTNGGFAMVDAADFEQLVEFRWWRDANGYARRWDPAAKTSVYMHREILNPPAGVFVDHANGNRLDNQRSNIRFATRGENMHNSKTWGRSRYKGVSWNCGMEKWQARIQVRGESRGLGYFNDEVSAARAYDQAARELGASFARLNFPEVAA